MATILCCEIILRKILSDPAHISKVSKLRGLIAVTLLKYRKIV